MLLGGKKIYINYFGLPVGDGVSVSHRPQAKRFHPWLPYQFQSGEERSVLGDRPSTVLVL
jgi:hypothetical protein